MSSIEPDDGGGEIDGGKEVLPAFVVPCSNGSELLEFGKEVLDEVAGFVEIGVIGARRLAVGAGWNNWNDPHLFEGLDHPLVGIVSFVGKESASLQAWQQGVGTDQIVDLPGREMEARWVAQGIGGGVDLGRQPTLAAPNRLLLAIPPFAPALCWWARTMVLSIMAYSVSASSAKCWKSVAQTPLLAQRVKRVCTAFHGPYRSGRSRHGMPARYRYSTASTNRRLSFAVTPTCPARPGSKSWIRSH